MTPEHVATDLRNAYEAHDRNAFDRALDRVRPLVGLGPDIGAMTLAQLEVRRHELHGQLARVNDRIARLERETCQRANAERKAWAQTQDAKRMPLDASDDEYPFG